MRLLLLAGTHEARHIAVALLREPVNVTVSLARAERRPQSFGWPVRIGGWGGEGPFRDWLLRENVTAIVDATHPFANAMNHRTARVGAELGIDVLRYVRPGWLPSEDDLWTFLNTAEEAATHIPVDATVFLATGRRDLHDFSNLRGRRILCRVRDGHGGEFPIPGGRFVYAPGPFTVGGECSFFLREGIEWIVTRNSGGQGSWPKLEAARELGLNVAMIRRPKQPDMPKVFSVAETLSWVRRRL